MATPTGTDTIHATLTGTTIDVCTLTTRAPYVDVTSASGATDLWITWAIGATPADPSAGSPPAGSIRVPTGRTKRIGGWLQSSSGAGNVFTIKVLGNANAYDLEGSYY